MGKNRKISDKEFLATLRECAGLYARTARMIEVEFGIKYSRQAVRARAEQFKEELEDIEQQNIDIAEEGLHSLMRSKNERVKLRAIELYLKTKGKKRGYIERQEVDHTSKGEKIQGIDYSKLSTSALREIANAEQNNSEGSES